MVFQTWSALTLQMKSLMLQDRECKTSAIVTSLKSSRIQMFQLKKNVWVEDVAFSINKRYIKSAYWQSLLFKRKLCWCGPFPYNSFHRTLGEPWDDRCAELEMFMNLHLNKLSASGENSRLLLHNVTKKVKTLGEYPQIRVLLSAISKTPE